MPRLISIKQIQSINCIIFTGFKHLFVTLGPVTPIFEVLKICKHYLSRVVRKPAFCICENKDADQLRGNREADQRLCFRYTDSTIRLLSKSEISRLYPSSAAVQPGLCRTWSETPKTGFLRTRLICFVLFCCCLTSQLTAMVMLRLLPSIRITCPCNEHPLTPHVYIEKVGFTRVYRFFLFLLQNIDCGYSLEPPH